MSRAPRTDARIVKSRRALQTALLELVAEMPFEDLTVAAITTRAHVGYATFFRHYPSREALLAEIADDLIGQLVVLIAPLVASRDTGAAANALAVFVDTRRSLCRGLLVGAGEAMRRDITGRAVAAAGSAEAPTPSWLPRDLGIIHTVAATLTILQWWLEQDRPQTAASVADILEKLVFAPISWR